MATLKVQKIVFFKSARFIQAKFQSYGLKNYIIYKFLSFQLKGAHPCLHPIKVILLLKSAKQIPYMVKNAPTNVAKDTSE